MKLPSKRLITAGAAAIGVALAQAPPAAPPRAQMSGVAFKNVQILKDIPVDEFMGTMGLFSAALSVCCGDCHVGAGGDNPDWASDAIPRKKMARVMMAMVDKINKDNFGGRKNVTCWTCHRGVSDPAVTPSLDSIYSEPNIVPSDVLKTATSGVPTVDQIFDKYIQAIGGAANTAKIASYTAKGQSMLFGSEKTDPAEVYAKAPNQLALLILQREGTMARVSDGRQAWVMLPLTVVKEYPLYGSLLEGGKLEGEMAFPWRIKQFFSTWHVSFPITLDGRAVYVVQGTGNPTGMFATFYFDKQTGLLTRMIRYVNTAEGRVPTQIDYSDYRDIAGGVKMPFHYIYGWVSGREEYTLTQITPNVNVDASRFVQPVPSAK